MGQTHSAPPADARRFRHMACATYFNQLDQLRHFFHPSLVALQISRATYLDICAQEQVEIDAVTDSIERETRANALQDERMEFFSAIERGRIVLGDTVLHVAVRLAHEAIVDFLLLTDHVPRPLTAGPAAPTPKIQRPASRGGGSKSTGSGLNSTQTPNFKGELPYDVAHTTAMRLVLDGVADVHEAFGVEYKDEPKVHRLVRSLRRVWPVWMYDGPQEAASLVRVIYGARSSDAAFGALVKVAVATADRCRIAVGRAGVRIAAKVLQDTGRQMSTAKDTVVTTWDADHKRRLLFAVFSDCFREWKHRRHANRDAAFAAFFEDAMVAWLSVAMDLDTASTVDADAATLRRYDLQVWQRRVRLPPSLVDELCSHLSTLEQHLSLPHLAV